MERTGDREREREVELEIDFRALASVKACSDELLGEGFFFLRLSCHGAL
jgi:hypothetical protein